MKLTLRVSEITSLTLVMKLNFSFTRSAGANFTHEVNFTAVAISLFLQGKIQLKSRENHRFSGLFMVRSGGLEPPRLLTTGSLVLRVCHSATTAEFAPCIYNKVFWQQSQVFGAGFCHFYLQNACK